MIRDLSPRKASNLETTVIVSRTAGTTDAYRRAFLRWKSFASSRDEIQAFPAKPEHVALYLQYLMDTTHWCEGPVSVWDLLFGLVSSVEFVHEQIEFRAVIMIIITPS